MPCADRVGDEAVTVEIFKQPGKSLDITVAEREVNGKPAICVDGVYEAGFADRLASVTLCRLKCVKMFEKETEH